MVVTLAPSSPLKANQAALDAEQNRGRSPPAYVHYGTYPNPYPATTRRSGQSAAMRFFGAFCVAIGIYVLFGMLTTSIAWRSDIGSTSPDGSSQGWPVPSDGDAPICVGGGGWTAARTDPASTYPYTAHTEFELPLASDVQYLLARGHLAYGSVQVVDWEEGKDNIKIEVDASYYSQAALDRANVCKVSRKEGENGVGIFTPREWRRIFRKDQIRFDLVVRIPVRRASSVRVHAFETDLAMFSHDFQTSKRVVFDSLSVHGSNMAITATSLQAEHATLKTSNGPITGVFNTTTSLELVTSNAPIKADVGLTNAPPLGAPTTLVIKTSNGPVHSVVSLLSTRDEEGSYDVTTETSNNVLDVAYDAAPVELTLVHHGRTSNGPVTLTLPRAYEGALALRSSNIAPSVSHDENAEDPTGRGRRRWLSVNRVKNVLSGAVYWGSAKAGKGSVDVRTSNAPARLVLA
ncbi:hypothetical protein FIBSPDRAFT_1049269 [Athelia psychrophila]|uniref:Uncharacterized protein n=1 Tax=Athelia psychrophila TaxID=1759441 RepID=A0A166CKT5_9AGAM|nr:hypothetical protein FIBSPDRAFT_1049269 [Fibularhizoctonia sp. CBS 109695]